GSVLTKCAHCAKMIMPHQVCKFCGFYKGREVLNILAKELKKREKNNAKRAK
ncbi:50S ribosomal protein L32, partial [Candidatus Nomurabacteria bacterium RIFCSPLOWO2_01_FULL_40_15]